jgi:hypothetical protein
MVIYFHNQHTAPLEQALRVLLYNTDKTAEQDAAVRAALSCIEQEKQKAPYRLWLKSQPQPTQEQSREQA